MSFKSPTNLHKNLITINLVGWLVTGNHLDTIF